MPEAVHGTSASTVGGLQAHVLAGQAQAVQILADPDQAVGIGIQGQQVDIGQLQQMGGLAAGRGAGVQHPHAILGRQQFGGQLGAGVLHRPPALGKPRQPLHRARGIEHDRIGRRPRTDARQGMGLQSGVGKRRQHLLARNAAPIDAQSHRARALARGEDLLPMRGMVTLQQFDPPGRKVLARDDIAGERRPQASPFAQIAAQHRVDEAFGTLRRRFDGLIDQGMRRVRRLRIDELGQGADQQFAHRFGRRAVDQTREQGIGEAALAHAAVGDVLDGAARTGRDAAGGFGQRLRHGAPLRRRQRRVAIGRRGSRAIKACPDFKRARTIQ